MARMQRSGSVCWLLGLALATAVPLSASSDEECDRWLKISSLQKRKIVLDSFKKKTRRIANPERDRCINEAAASIQTEVDAACRNGSVLRTAWADSGLGWSVTCTAVVARSRAGHRVTLADRKQIRKAWDDCVEREGDPESCRKPVLEYYITQANATDLSECAAFANLPTGSRLNEVHDRIQMRFSIAEEIAECLRASSHRIAGEVRALCEERDANAFQAWEDVLNEHTNRCLGGNPGGF